MDVNDMDTVSLFFHEAGYNITKGKPYALPQNSGRGNKLFVEFEVSMFDPSLLEDELAKRWIKLPIKLGKRTTERLKKTLERKDTQAAYC